jgi:hypothetical protein
MASNLVEIRVEGEAVKVPSTCINGRRIISRGKWLKMAVVQDLVEDAVVEDPEFIILELQQGNLDAHDAVAAFAVAV